MMDYEWLLISVQWMMVCYDEGVHALLTRGQLKWPKMAANHLVLIKATLQMMAIPLVITNDLMLFPRQISIDISTFHFIESVIM